MLDRITHEIRASGAEIFSILVRKNGTTLLEEYFHGHGPRDLQRLYSCTKSISSLLVGLAIEVKGLDYDMVLNQRVVDLFADFEINNPSDRKNNLKVEHLLNQTTGINWKETGRPWSEGHSGYDMEKSANWVEFVLGQEMTSDSGKRFNYNTGVSHLLTVLVEILTGMPADKFANKYLFEPLGITSSEWTRDSHNYVQGGKGLSLSPDALARIGQMVMAKGQFEGRQIINEEWLEMSLSPQSKGHKYYGTYGFQWWLKNLAEGPEPDTDGYNIRCGIGYGGQFIYMVPKWDLLVVMTGNMIGAEKFEIPQNIFKDQILALFQS